MRRSVRATATSVATAMASLAMALLPHALMTSASAAETTVSGVRLNSYEARLLTDINNTRRVHGLGGLQVVPGATDVARRWAWHLAGAQGLSHNPSLVANIGSAGSGAWTMIAENVGMAPSSSPDTLFNAYMNSAPHRANILDGSARFLGVGVVERAGTAWNTLDFTNAYSTRYGRTRVPPAGMSRDSATPSATTTLASLEGGADQRFGTSRTGGVKVSLPSFSGVTAGNDRVSATLTRTSTAAGYAQLFLRNAVNLRNLRYLRLQLAATDPRHRAVQVHVQLSRAYGSTVSLGYATVGATAKTVTFALPSSARTLRDTVSVSVGGRQVSAAGGSVRLSVLDVSALS